MSTNIEIDQELLNEALVLGGLKTKKAVVNEALVEYVRFRKQRSIIGLFGQISFDPAYNYKTERDLR